MPRKRTIDDDALLDAALDIVHREGPAALSFSALGERVGLAGSTVVQRFGTKPGLLRAALLRAWDALDAATASADAASGAGVDGIVQMLVALSGDYTEHDYADQLLVLREDLRDPVLRERGNAWIGTLSGMVERRLDGAVPAPVDGLGPLVVAQWQGALTVWSFTRPGPIPAFVETQLRVLLTRLAEPTGTTRARGDAHGNRRARRDRRTSRPA